MMNFTPLAAENETRFLKYELLFENVNLMLTFCPRVIVSYCATATKIMKYATGVITGYFVFQKE